MRDDFAAARRQLEVLQGPGPAKVREASRREQSEARATVAFALGLEADGASGRAFAKRVGVCERIVRDWLSGARNVPIFVAMFLNRDGQIAFVKSYMDQIPATAEAAE